MEIGFFSKEDWRSLADMEDIFMPKKNRVWFVEEINCKKWITEDSDHVTMDFDTCTPNNPNGEYIIYNGTKMKKVYDKIQLTNDPLKAKQFKTQMDALTYCIANKLGLEYTQTEHEFI